MNKSVSRVVSTVEKPVRRHIAVEVIAYGIIAELCQTVISVILKTKVRRIGYVTCRVVGESFGGNNRIIEQILNSS